MVVPKPAWVPDRQDIIWIDCNPQVGQEMPDIHAFLVLSPRIFNEKTSLVIGLPMTTAAYNADNPFAVAVGKPEVEKQRKPAMYFATNPSRLTGVYAMPNRTRSNPCRTTCLYRFVSD